MDATVKSVVATVLMCLYLPVPVYLLWILVLDRTWKRLGARSYLLHTPVYLGMVAVVALLHPLWRTGALPWHWLLEAAGALLVAAGLALVVITYRDIDFRTLIMQRQISTGDRPLITTGLYGVIRHPRYLAVILGAVGTAAMTGYPPVIAASAGAVVLTLWAVQLEERELVAHFGAAYEDYARRVPGFIPRRGNQ